MPITGCRVGPRYVRPALPTAPPAAYKENTAGSRDSQAGGWRPAKPSDAMIRGKWWEVFGDPELNVLEERLNINNQNIKQYFENYMAARAVVRNAKASLYPSFSIAPSVNVQGTGESSTARLSTSSSTQSYELPLSVSWEPDLFGSIRNTIREQANAAQVSAANLANETLSEQASLAEYYFELRGQDALQVLYDDTIKNYGESLRLTRVLFRTGIDSEQDVVQAETTLHTAEANATAVATTRAQYEHAIALLLGEAAGNFSLQAMPLDVNVPSIPTGLPSQLLERRPDIAASERTMAEANALIGVGKAAYYPTISLTGSGGTQTSDIGKLATLSAYFWSVGGTITETAWDFGARRATVQQYEAQYRADVAAYRQTVLNAFKEVEDYLVSTRQLTEQTQRQKQAVDSSARYEALANTRYRTGVDTYLNVVTAQTSLLSNRQTLVSLQTSQMTSAVQLIAALGGGWDAAELPTEKQVERKP
ncbi:MAG: efflux transporter outer membrane subunit [Edaphobacter sp.]|uniref:efflux transporter outer membrane subunit n=1 Tax=Edaphobacter sp. TaxID=1934404 RepID=UPI0023A1B48D|nr:efflux transporter outer membrane subunit [Edaphobacter sp.]MDE1176337.1 efflux transporter outer membrane subunit [Edaphobacter sp.]